MAYHFQKNAAAVADKALSGIHKVYVELKAVALIACAVLLIVAIAVCHSVGDLYVKFKTRLERKS
jgi:hypothetical protein